MANIKTPGGEFYLDDTQFDVDYSGNLVTYIGEGGEDGNSLSLDGGTMNADAVINGTEELQITTADSNESATVGVTSQGVTIVHNTNSDADASVRVIENTVEISANGTVVTINGSGVNFGDSVLTGVYSIGGNAVELAVETDMDMNNHRIKMVGNPVDSTDAVNLGYITGGNVAAATTQHGTILQGASVAEATGADDIVAQFNALLVSLRNAGIIAD